MDYNQNGLEISPLLSWRKYRFHLQDDQHQQLLPNRKGFLEKAETNIENLIPDDIKQQSEEDVAGMKRLFWWLWRCLPEATSQVLGDSKISLLPAETRLPDSSIWSHASLTSALAGALAGYDLTTEQIEQKWSSDRTLSHPYLAIFSFSPIQELIKASRKRRDFFARSWLLHYLSATVSSLKGNLA